VPNLKFLASADREIVGRVPKFQNWVTWPPHDPFWPNFEFFSLELTAVSLLAKFEVSSFNRSRDIRGTTKFQNWVTLPPHDPFWPNFEFFSLELTVVHLRAKLEVSSFNRSRDIRGIPKFQNWIKWPPHKPFLPNFAFFVRTHRLSSPCQIWSF